MAELGASKDPDSSSWNGPGLEPAPEPVARQLGARAEARFFRSVAAGDLNVEPLSTDDYTRLADLADRHADLPLGGTDSSLIAIAEREAPSATVPAFWRHLPDITRREALRRRQRINAGLGGARR